MHMISRARGRAFDRRLMTSVSILAVLTSAPSLAIAADQAAQAPNVEEIVVTGSRIIRNGYEAPTPVTVVGVDQLQDSAKPNIADVLNQMPAFQGSLSPTTSAVQNGGKAGGNNLNLRNLGSNRTLILFDGRRTPPAFVDGSVDINLLPDTLISRVDVVTGGASAVYGSDAVAGVVNFVLDTTFSGVKGTTQGGVTGRGDGRNWKVQLAAGTTFAYDRGHIIVAGDASNQDALPGTARDWNLSGFYGIANPAYTATNGNPQYLYRYQVAHANGYKGGIITAGPLKGIAFGPGGTPFQYNYGNFFNASYQQGGTWQDSTQAGAANLMVGSNAHHMFVHASYDVTDDFQVFAEFSNAGIRTNSRCCFPYYLGNLTIKTDNPFIPASVAAQAAALKVTSFAFGEILHVTPDGFGTQLDRLSDVYAIGAKGKFGALDTSWSWNAYFQRGITKLSFYVPHQPLNDRFTAAIDAVRAPNGSIVCRSNLTGGNPGCVPYNVFGIDVVSQAAVDYIMGPGGPSLSQTIAQSVAGISATGEPFSSWAGPVSIAVDAEWRKESVAGINDPYSPNRAWYSTQLTSFPGSYHVGEGAIETVIPLAKDTAWAKTLDFNGAIRFTDYSASGYVTTWKAGLTYNPIDDLRVRFTQSRDIRAPTLTDLFSTPQTNHNTITDPFKGNASFAYFQVTKGNPNLKPEKADTTGIGVVYQPSWFQGFSASVDFYRINVKGAISTVSFNDVLNNCFAGTTLYCSQVIRLPDGTLDSIVSQPINVASQLAKGIDYEASYQSPLSAFVDSWNGDINMRVVATNTLNLITNTGVPGTTQILEGAGVGNVPDWSATGTFTYSNDPIRFAWTTRYVSSMIIANTRIECQSGCPNRPGFTTVDYNHEPAYWLSNFTINYRFYSDGRNNAEAFFTVDNVFDKEPPLSPNFGGTTYGVIANGALYDLIGRSFRAGVRFRM